MQLIPLCFEKHAVFIRESSYDISITSVLFCLTSAVQRVYFGRSTCLLRPFNVLTSAVQRAYFGRSTCLLRPFNVLTSAVQRAYFGRSKTNTSGVLGKYIGLIGNFQGFKTISRQQHIQTRCVDMLVYLEKGSFSPAQNNTKPPGNQ